MSKRKNLILLLTIFFSINSSITIAQSKIPQKGIGTNVSRLDDYQPITLKPISGKSSAAEVRGTGVFSTSFSNTAVGKNEVNAYLLCYLSTVVYPQYLAMAVNAKNPEVYETQLQTNPTRFKGEFEAHTKKFFSADAEFKFIQKSDRLGYDPEAMVISTSTTIFVVFRGTDRVGSNNPKGFLSGKLYDFAEWVSTDFDAVHHSTPELTGKIHKGMWLSMEHDGFKTDLYNYIAAKGGATKKIWITGHSLGGGQAQLYAMYMAKRGLKPHGIYVYASPHPGTLEFVTEMDRLFPGGRLQRFDFIDDPITTVGPKAMGYHKAGTRVYYDDVNTMRYNEPERSEAEVLKIIPAILGAIGNGVSGALNGTTGGVLKLDNYLGSSHMCYHHPLWYLKAARNQIEGGSRLKLPRVLDLPDAGSEACDLLTVQRGLSANFFDIAKGTVNEVGQMLGETGQVISEAAETIRFSAASAIDNVLGTAIENGNYYIKSYASNGRLLLNEVSGLANDCDLKLTSERRKVKIERNGAVGYTISFGTVSKTKTDWFGNQVIETIEYLLDSDTENLFSANVSNIILWERNNVPAFNANQRWLFLRLAPGKYLIKNVANGKLLDAGNNCNGASACGVDTRPAITDDQSQIWVVEKN